MAQHAKKTVLTLLLCAQRTANAYIANEEARSFDKPTSTKVYDQIRKLWAAKQRNLTSEKNEANSLKVCDACARCCCRARPGCMAPHLQT